MNKFKFETGKLIKNSFDGFEYIAFGINDTYKNRKIIIEQALYFLLEKLKDNSNIYILTGDINFRIKNRISNYYRLWKGMRKSGLEFDDQYLSNEYMIETENEIKFWGAIRLERSLVVNATKLLTSNIYTYLILAPRCCDINSILKKGFIRTPLNDVNYINEISRLNSIILIKEGEFDDFYTGFLGVGKQKDINKLYNQINS